jgi:hypothetical protein
MNIPLGEVVHFDVTTRNIATGVGCDADAAPTFSVFEEDTDTAIVTGTMTKRTALTGDYRGTFTASTANGFEVGKFYIIVVAGTVGGIVDKEVISSFRVSLTEVVVGSAPVDLATWLGTAPLVLEDQQVQAVVPATQQTYLAGVLKTAIPAESMEGRDAAALGKLLDVATPVLTAASVNQTIDNPTAASIAALILATPANKLVTDASGYVTYANAAPPTAGAVASQVRTELTTELARIDAAITTRMATFTYTTPPTAAAISTQVATDLATGHGAGSWLTATGFALASVWTPTIAAYLDVAVSSRLATMGYTAPDNAGIAAILIDTGTDGVVVAPASKTGYALTASERTAIANAVDVVLTVSHGSASWAAPEIDISGTTTVICGE